jgi:histidyl-tRNA synthetase
LLEGKSLGEQLKYAGRRGIGLAAIVGPDEAARGAVAIKDLVSGDQVEIERAELIERMTSRIESSTE